MVLGGGRALLPPDLQLTSEMAILVYDAPGVLREQQILVRLGSTYLIISY